MCCCPALSRKYIFFSVMLSTASGYNHLSASSSTKIPEPWDKRSGINVPFRTNHSMVSCSLQLGQLKVSVIIAIYCKERIF
jgi:hypothetical protein